MFECPKCGHGTIVKQGRLCDNEFVRVRRCNSCGNIFYTAESCIEWEDGYNKISEYWRKRNGIKARRNNERSEQEI